VRVPAGHHKNPTDKTTLRGDFLEAGTDIDRGAVNVTAASPVAANTRCRIGLVEITL